MRHKIKDISLYISLEEAYLWFRRWFYYRFRRKKMMEKLAKREGHCAYMVCGDLCCGYYNCKYFDFKTKKCKIHKTKPKICKLTPFDEKDKPRRIKFVCNYCWKK